MRLSVIVVTLNRADCVERCLACLAAQGRAVEQVIVVDASTDAAHRERTRRATEAYAGSGTATYLRNEAGYGHMTMSRNIGLEHARGDIIAFIDDDAFALPDWSERLLETYGSSPEIGGVGGRVVKNEAQLAEPVRHGPVKIGVLRRDGMIGGEWTVDCGRQLDVEHLMGCNMSFRRAVLAELGGLRDEYPGPEVREETDLCFRVRRRGHRLVYNPKATVIHIGGAKPVGRRFDFRYEYWGRHNHTYLLIRNFGWSLMLLRYLISSTGMDLRTYARQALRRGGRELPGAIWGLVVIHVGKAAGFMRGSLKRLSDGLDPVRRDEVGQRLARLLNGGDGKPPVKTDVETQRLSMLGAAPTR